MVHNVSYYHQTYRPNGSKTTRRTPWEKNETDAHNFLMNLIADGKLVVPSTGETFRKYRDRLQWWEWGKCRIEGFWSHGVNVTATQEPKPLYYKNLVLVAEGLEPPTKRI